jgi:hypothetical protein
MVIGSLLAILVPCGEGGFHVNKWGTMIWSSPDSSWCVAGFGQGRACDLIELLRSKPAGAEVLKLYEAEVNEPGEWLGFSVVLVGVERVVFTKRTKIVLIDRGGKRVESEACLFPADRMQTRVYDTRRESVVISKRTVWCRSEDGLPSGMAKFPAGSFRLKDIVEFEVVGAIVDTLERSVQ